jgi:hypothetical protein
MAGALRFCLEEVGHWLPQRSGLLTPVGSDEPFQAKNLFLCYLHHALMTIINRDGKQEKIFGFLRSKRVGQRITCAFLLSSLALHSFNKFATHHTLPA